VRSVGDPGRGAVLLEAQLGVRVEGEREAAEVGEGGVDGGVEARREGRSEGHRGVVPPSRAAAQGGGRRGRAGAGRRVVDIGRMDTAKPLVAPMVYPETDHMGEHEQQFQIAVLLVPLVAAWLALRGVVARVAGNQFWYWVEGDIARCRAPDVYVVDGVGPDAPDHAVWKTWEGYTPAFALEVVSDAWKKDYTEVPADYDAMGARELVVFDPGATERSRKRVRWQVFRRVRDRGLVRVFAGMGDRVESKALGCWIRRVDEAGKVRLRLGTGGPRRRASPHRRRTRRHRATRQGGRARGEGRGPRGDCAAAGPARTHDGVNVAA
jgi:hypothetical protein